MNMCTCAALVCVGFILCIFGVFVCLFICFELCQAFSYNSAHILPHKSLLLTLQLYVQFLWKYIQSVRMLLTIGKKKINKTDLRFVYAVSFAQM